MLNCRLELVEWPRRRFACRHAGVVQIVFRQLIFGGDVGRGDLRRGPHSVVCLRIIWPTVRRQTVAGIREGLEPGWGGGQGGGTGWLLVARTYLVSH